MRSTRSGPGAIFATALLLISSCSSPTAPLPRLVFTTQPPNTIAGSTISPALQVAIQDASGSTLTAAADTVTIALGANPGTATLLGTKTVKVVNGVAIFDALSIQKAGTGYTLTAASGPLIGATSTPFSIVAAPSSQLQFKTQPSNTTAGTPFSPAIEVVILDAFGNTVTTANDQVLVVLGVNPGGGTLLGTPAVAAIGGVARFSNLVVQKAASGYGLTASAGVLPLATSTPFSIAAAAAVQLLFSLQPTDGQGNLVMPPVAVTIRDAFGNFATDSVTLTIGANPWGGPGTRPGALSGTTRRGPVNGIASFGDLRVDKPGAGYTLFAAAGGASGPSAPFRVGLTFSSVAAGVMHTCAITRGGAYCWGNNYNGRLGAPTGALAFDSVPVLVSGGLSFASISAGANQSCGVTTSHMAYCWGINDNGELGNGTTAPSLAPGPVTGALSFTSVSAGFGHTCGATTDRAVYCWGANDSGQVGNGTRTRSLTPALVSGSGTTLPFASVTAGESFSCGLTTGNAVYCWGDNQGGQLGNGTTVSSSTPVLVSGSGTTLLFTSVSADAHTCGLTTSNAAYCWGYNYAGQLGTGTSTLPATTPVAVSGGLSFGSVSAGADDSCGVTTGNVAYCWGFNSGGRLGIGDTTTKFSPVAVSGGLSFASVSTGFHTCGLTTNNVLYCWGYNYNGQVGDGTRVTPRLTPVRAIQ
jgi:alpha-tubulin suppressor-like RCC1 family protein